MSATPSDPWPTEVRVKRADRALEIDFDTGEHFRFTAEFLRVESPSAEVKGHGAGEKKTVPGKRDVGIEGVDPVGNYAIRIRFDDGHDTGLFSWAYLYELGQRHDEIWRAYLDALDAKGLTREPPKGTGRLRFN